MKINVLLVDDDPACLDLAEACLRDWPDGPKLQLRRAGDAAAALAALHHEAFQLALVDLHYAGVDSGFSLLRSLREVDERLELIVVSSAVSFSAVREAMRAGAGDYVAKGFGPVELRHSVEQALARRRWRGIEARSRPDSPDFSMVGDSGAMEKMRSEIRRLGPHGAPLLIEGETGSGKELAARALHFFGRDSAGPFVAVNCAAIPLSLADSQLFGHERGAFSGADRARPGFLEQADGGTLFLDEINSLPLEVQAKLLRALQEREVRRVGSSRVLPLDFRLLCATNQPLDECVRAGSFREDLLYRVRVLGLRVPPLRERLSDLPALAASFLPRRVIGAEVLRALGDHSWPGNVRELRNLLLAMDAMAPPGQPLALEHLPEHHLRALSGAGAASAELGDLSAESGGLDFAEAQANREREFLERAYRGASGNVSRMARLLGVDRSHLHHKLTRLGIHRTRP